MHELSIAESICRSVAERVGGARVDEMVVQVGALSGVNRHSLDLCLGEAARLEGVQLSSFEVQMVPAHAVCDCGHGYDVDDFLQPCPRCGGFSRSFTDGEDIVVSRLVVVEDDEPAN